MTPEETKLKEATEKLDEVTKGAGLGDTILASILNTYSDVFIAAYEGEKARFVAGLRTLADGIEAKLQNKMSEFSEKLEGTENVADTFLSEIILGIHGEALKVAYKWQHADVVAGLRKVAAGIEAADAQHEAGKAFVRSRLEEVVLARQAEGSKGRA